MSLFISHSSKDKEIADDFIDLIVGAQLIDIHKIICSSADGTTFKSGDNWRESIRKGLEEAQIILLLITINYKNSEICQNEMGAAWMLANSKVIPLILEPITYKSVGVLQEVNQIENLVDEASLERIKDYLLSLFPGQIKSDRWSVKKKEFIAKAKKYSSRILEEVNSHERSNRSGRGEFTDFIVDSSLSHKLSLSNIDLNSELISDLQKDKSFIDLKFNYLGNLCAANWIALSSDPSYGHSELMEIIKKNMDEVVSACQLTKETEIDIISLGPGDGKIDRYILHTFQNNVNLRNYYPLDLSFDLLQKATSEVIQTKWLRKNFKIKAIHGDFTKCLSENLEGIGKSTILPNDMSTS